jgi:hypothetical protein
MIADVVVWTKSWAVVECSVCYFLIPCRSMLVQRVEIMCLICFSDVHVLFIFTTFFHCCTSGWFGLHTRLTCQWTGSLIINNNNNIKILDTPTCLCGTKDQTIDHLLYECELLNKERDSLISTVLQTDVWPISKETLIRKHLKIFVKFTNEISFDKRNEVSNPPCQAS